jgi:uncharacterized protein YyaL (SSP411 family)
MLYDNALLAVAYLEGYQATGDAAYRRVVEETLDYVLREMTSPDGPFYSTQDADSEGVEGKFYVWSMAEVEALLGEEPAATFSYVYDVSPEGNWEEHSILHRAKTDEQDAKLLGMDVSELRKVIESGRPKLFEARSRRVWPGRDEKTLTSWNGLMIAALAQAGAVLDLPRFTEAAGRAADFLLGRMRAPDGRLLRTYGAGSPAKLNGYLEDYAFVIDALVSLYEATFEPRWVKAAVELTEVMIDQFWDASQGGFYYTGRDHEQLIARTKDPHDSSIPSGNSMAVTALLRLAKLTGRGDFREKAEATLHLFSGLMASSPMAAAQMLLALDFYVGPVQEFAVVGPTQSPETKRALRAIRSGFRPNKVTAFQATADGPRAQVESIPLLAGKTEQGAVTTYICQDFTCQAPLVGAEAVEIALKGS